MKVDREYAVNTARAARNAGVKYYSLVSAMGANDKSWSTQVKTKGIVEREIIQMGFENFTIMRPGYVTYLVNQNSLSHHFFICK